MEIVKNVLKILDATDYMFQKFNIFTIYNEFRE